MEKTLSRQKIWGWKVVLYLFLAGLGAGAYTVGVLLYLIFPHSILFLKIGVVLGSPIVAASTVFLIWDLGRPSTALRSFCNPLISWISRGTIILTLFVILGALHIAGWIWPFHWLQTAETLHLVLCVINGILGIMVLIYTGLLLGDAKLIAFWNTPILPLLFLVSGISTGIVSIVMLSSAYGFFGQSETNQTLFKIVRYDIALLSFEALIIYFYLHWAYKSNASSRTSVDAILSGKLAFSFWGGVVGAGMVVPVSIDLIFVLGAALPPQKILLNSVILGIAGIVGGLSLRHVIVGGGVKVPIYVEGFTVSISSRR